MVEGGSDAALEMPGDHGVPSRCRLQPARRADKVEPAPAGGNMADLVFIDAFEVFRRDLGCLIFFSGEPPADERVPAIMM